MRRDEKRGMEAVASKLKHRRKRPVLAKKGKAPGMAIMIAVGAPKKGMEPPMREEMGGNSEKIAQLKAEIARLKAKLAEYEGEEEEMDESDDEMDDDDDEDMA